VPSLNARELWPSRSLTTDSSVLIENGTWPVAAMMTAISELAFR
jgi:hypothetical protein